MAEAYRPYLDHPGLYPALPTEWLHMTILKVGYTTDFSEQEMAAMAEELKPSLSSMRLPELSMGDVWLWPLQGNPVLRITPEAPVTEIFKFVTAAMNKVLGHRVSRLKPFIPHVALAYNRTYYREKELYKQLTQPNIPPVKFRANKLSLLKQSQTIPFYQWEVIQNIPIGQA